MPRLGRISVDICQPPPSGPTLTPPDNLQPTKTLHLQVLSNLPFQLKRYKRSLVDIPVLFPLFPVLFPL